jgi:hypothetical protein
MSESQQQICDVTKKIALRFQQVKDFQKELSHEMLSAKMLLERMVGFLSDANDFIKEYYRLLEIHVKPLIENDPSAMYFYSNYSKHMQQSTLPDNLKNFQAEQHKILENKVLAEFSLGLLKGAVNSLRLTVVNYTLPLAAMQDPVLHRDMLAMQQEARKFYTALYQVIPRVEHSLTKIREHGIPFESNPTAYRLSKAAKMQNESDSCFASLVSCVKTICD